MLSRSHRNSADFLNDVVRLSPTIPSLPPAPAVVLAVALVLEGSRDETSDTIGGLVLRFVNAFNSSSCWFCELSPQWMRMRLFRGSSVSFFSRPLSAARRALSRATRLYSYCFALALLLALPFSSTP